MVFSFSRSYRGGPGAARGINGSPWTAGNGPASQGGRQGGSVISVPSGPKSRCPLSGPLSALGRRKANHSTWQPMRRFVRMACNGKSEASLGPGSARLEETLVEGFAVPYDRAANFERHIHEFMQEWDAEP